MEKLEQLFAEYNITAVVVNGKQLLDLTNKYAETLEAMPKLELVSCVENAKEIVEVINQPTKGEVRRFQGPGRSTEAAILIQAHVRRLQAQKRFMEFKRRTAAANIIRAAWLRRNWVKKIRKSLLATRAMQALLSQQRLKTLEQNWDEFIRNDHVFVHIPSVGYSEQMRRSLRDSGDLHHMEVRQIARLCEVRGHTTHVVLVTRASIPDELLEYYDQLLGLAGAIRTGEEKDRCSQSTRFRIIVPEAVKQFQSPAAPPLCLSSLLKYSSNALKNIRSFIVGRPAIIVPGVGAHPDDFAVAAELGIPVWTARPQVFHLFARQSTCRRLVKQLSETKSYGAGLLTGKFSTVSRKRANVRGGLPEATGHSQTDGKSSERLQPDRPVLQPPGDYDVYTLDRGEGLPPSRPGTLP
ncbi:unnamed protein product [Dicrocoelium dendriticum]|nr:unnamed protein product [Dicrocoelium dendriticum]